MGHGATNGESSLARALLARLRPSLHATQQALHGARDELSPAKLDEALGALQPALEMIDALQSFLEPPCSAACDLDLVTWLVSRESSTALVVESDLADHEARSLLVHVDPRQLDACFEALLRNAEQAGARRVSLSAARDGALIELRIEDDGQGMPPQLATRAFEPFVSGDDGRLGLGLAAVQRFAGAHGGTTRVEVGGEGGTIIVLALPSASPRKPTVLVVDDEPLTLKAARRALERGGYRVVTADNVTEALSALSEHDDIEVLLSDVVMPEMSGVELGQKLRELQPELVEVFTSGYPPELVPDLPAGADFIEKPFSGRELSQLVDQLLERRRGDAS